MDRRSRRRGVGHRLLLAARLLVRGWWWGAEGEGEGLG